MEWLALGLGLGMFMLGTYMVVHLDQQHKHVEMISAVHAARQERESEEKRASGDMV